ncbi:MAG: hypothetical protein H8E34_12395 [Bacteroidetes bacterium]|nr:hypothetical protein [Bacteroidota bacterium]
MRKLFFLTSIIVVQLSFGQDFNQEKTTLVNFIKRMYVASPFEGVKVIEDYDHSYLISVVSLEKAKYTSSSMLNRVAQVKARQLVNTFFNGATISSDIIIRTTEQLSKDSTSTTIETIESIKENSLGFVQGLELLATFDIDESKRVVQMYFKELK